MAGIIFIPRRVFPAGLNISKSRAIGNNRIFHATSALNYRAAFRFYGPRSTLYDQLAPREIQPNYIGGTKGRRGIVVINTLSPNRIYIRSNFLPAWKYLINISDVVYRRAKSQTSRKRRKNSKREYIYIYALCRACLLDCVLRSKPEGSSRSRVHRMTRWNEVAFDSSLLGDCAIAVPHATELDTVVARFAGVESTLKNISTFKEKWMGSGEKYIHYGKVWVFFYP